LIRSVYLRNFMSYVSAEIPFSPGVNFICGPNGSGKSSILIAISLALGMSRTERSKRLSDLIRWGSDAALIRVVLDNTKRNGSRPFEEFETDEVEVERHLTKSGSYPIKVNGIPTTKEELTSLLRKAGINPENMLIIMHQDMVEEFGLLPPFEKLRMLEEVMEFGSYRELDSLLKEERETRKMLTGSGRRVSEWERMYERYQRKRRLEDELEDLTAEAMWAKVNEIERSIQQLETRMGERQRERQRELQLVTRRAEELDRRIEESQLKVEDSWSELEEKRSQLVRAAAEEASLEARIKCLENVKGELLRFSERLASTLEEDLRATCLHP